MRPASCDSRSHDHQYAHTTAVHAAAIDAATLIRAHAGSSTIAAAGAAAAESDGLASVQADTPSAADTAILRWQYHVSST